MNALATCPIPTGLEPVLRAYRTCEFVTVARSGVPIAWPTVPTLRPDGTFLITTSIGLPQKAFNVRRNSHVALLFSDTTGSGLPHAPQILVQGEATCPPEIVTSPAGYEDVWAMLAERQPAGAGYSRSALGRRLFDWYYMRLMITIRPTAIRQTATGAAVPSAASASGRSRSRGAFAAVAGRMPDYASAVIATADVEGVPHLARVRPVSDPNSGTLRIGPPGSFAPGPASLLWHRHDEKLWNQRAFIAVGELAIAPDGCPALRPRRLVVGVDRLASPTTLRALVRMRRTARRYLASRGLPRPAVPWPAYADIYRQVAGR